MKQYNGEKAVISLTSWKARINTVSKTIYSLIKQCPGFHIVLCLSEEEFPQKEAELPDNLMLFVENDLIEILWVYKNYKSFKKVLFTMDKYRDVPVISADDDCLYKFNYAETLYQKWLTNKNAFVSFYREYYKGVPHTGGYATLHPPYCYGDILNFLDCPLLTLCEDDNFYTAIRYVKGLKDSICLNRCLENVVNIHDERSPLHDLYRRDKSNTFNKKLDDIVKLVNIYLKK
jgi:hypothetical protein